MLFRWIKTKGFESHSQWMKFFPQNCLQQSKDQIVGSIPKQLLKYDLLENAFLVESRKKRCICVTIYNDCMNWVFQYLRDSMSPQNVNISSKRVDRPVWLRHRDDCPRQKFQWVDSLKHRKGIDNKQEPHFVFACSKAASLSIPNETATVKFWVCALSAFTAAASWWKGFHSVESRYLNQWCKKSKMFKTGHTLYS